MARRTNRTKQDRLVLESEHLFHKFNMNPTLQPKKLGRGSRAGTACDSENINKKIVIKQLKI
jgi:hypothetical protein